MLPELNPRAFSPLAFQGCNFTPWTKPDKKVLGSGPLWCGSPSLMWEKDLHKAFPEDTAICVMYEMRGLVTERCLIHKSSQTIFFLNFWPDLRCLLCSCTSHATVFCDMQGALGSSAGLLLLLLLFWPLASLGAVVLYCWLLSSGIVHQDRIEVQERCRAHLGKNQRWAKCQLMKIRLCSISFNVMT